MRAYKAYASAFLKEGGKIFVPEIDGKVVGFMKITFNEQPELFGRFADTGNTGQTVVHKEFCGIGVGTALLTNLAKLARGFGYKAVDFGGPEPDSEYDTDEFDPFLAKSNLYTFNLRAVSVKASEIERDYRGKLGDLSRTSPLNRLLAHRPITWKIQLSEYPLGSEGHT